MTRAELWNRLKQAVITQSRLTECPSDNELKIVVQCAQVSAKSLVDFLCSLDNTKTVDKFTEKPIL